MYWPFGAPCIYEQQVPRSDRRISHDGLATVSKDEKELIPGVEGATPLNEIEASDSLQTKSHTDYAPSEDYVLSENGASKAPDSKPELGGQDPSGGGPSGYDAVISIASSRSAGTFATITYDALVIWSSRVGSSASQSV